MVTFGEYLCNIIQRYNLTISSVASRANIDRTLLSKAISGSRSLNRATFRKLISVLEPTKYETDTLTELYAASYFGETNYARIQMLKKYFTQNNIRTSASSGHYILPGSQAEVSDKTVFTDNIYSTKELIIRELQNEWNFVHPLIYTNYSFDTDFITEQLFLLMDKQEKKADLKHLVAFTAEDKKTDEINRFSVAVRFRQKGFATRYFITGDSKNHSADVPFPYYIVLSGAVLLFDGNLDSAVCIKDKTFALAYKAKFSAAFESSENLVKTLKDYTNPRELFLPYCSSTHEMTTFTNSLSLFINNSTINLISFDINDISCIRYINQLCDINSHIMSDCSFYNIILYKNAITDFIENGKIHGIPDEFGITVAPENRHRFLQEILHSTQQQHVSFCITDDSISNISDNIMITLFKSETFRNNLVLTNTFTSPGNTDIKSSCILTTDDAIVRTYSNFVDYLILFSYTANNQISLEYLEKQIDYAEKLYK